MNLPTTQEDGIRPHPSNWTKNPEQAETHCFYCREPVPEHKPDCVCMRRTIVVKFEAQMVITVPQSWSEEDIKFHFGGSSHCLSNELDQLHEEANRIEGICQICSRSKVTYLREATAEDHEALFWKNTTQD